VPGAGAVDGSRITPCVTIHADDADDAAANRVIHNFSPAARTTLCWAKLFGIIDLIIHRRAVIHG
jgi:hypothetical protein